MQHDHWLSSPPSFRAVQRKAHLIKVKYEWQVIIGDDRVALIPLVAKLRSTKSNSQLMNQLKMFANIVPQSP
jgi:hypothetical protein